MKASSSPREVISRSWAVVSFNSRRATSIGVIGVDENGLATDLDVVDARDGAHDDLDCAGQGRPDGPTGGQGLDLRGGPVSHDPAFADEHYPVGVGICLFEVVGGEDDRATKGSVVADRLPEVASAFDVHSLGRLVEEEQLRIGQQRHGEAKALLFSS